VNFCSIRLGIRQTRYLGVLYMYMGNIPKTQ